jgi:hypothetical protein
MSLLPAFAAVASLAAAFVALAQLTHAPQRAVRILSVLAALAMVPSLEEPSSWPWVALVAGAAGFATPLPCLFGAAAAAMTAFGATPVQPGAVGAPVLAAMAFTAGAASVGSEGAAWLRAGADRAWPAVLAGLALSLVAAFQGDGQSLAWRFSLGPPEARASIPGAGVLVGLALVVSLAGSLALLAHLLTPETPSAPVRRFGQGALVLGAGLGVLAGGFVLFRGFRVPDGLQASAGVLVALWLATALLIAALVVLIGPPRSGEAEPVARHAALEARIGCALAVAAAGVAGFEGWLRLGSYATPLTASAASAAVLALGAQEPTMLGLPRKALWLVVLAFVVVA